MYKTLKNSTNLKLLVVFVFGLLCSSINAQVGIGTNSPTASAQLEVNSSSKGFLPPRIALTSIADNTTISSPVAGLLIYNTATAGTSPNNVTPGFYYHNGSNWQRIVNSDKQTVKYTKLINNVSSSTTSVSGNTNVSNWTSTYNASGGDVLILANFSGFTSSNNAFVTYRIMRDGSSIATGNFYFNAASQHLTLPQISAVVENESGSHTYGIRIESGLILDASDYCTMVVTESNIP